MTKAQNNFPFEANRNTRHTELSHCNAVTKLHEAQNNFPFEANSNTRHTELSHCNAVTKLHEARIQNNMVP